MHSGHKATTFHFKLQRSNQCSKIPSRTDIFKNCPVSQRRVDVFQDQIL